MFPHTITLFNIVKDENNVITYNRKIVSYVFYYKEKIISKEGNGDKYTTAYNVIFSNMALKDYLDYDKYKNIEDKSKKFTLKENDIIVFGECEQITDLKDLQKSYKDYFLIRSIGDNRYGSDKLQNIEVTN